MAGAVIGYLVSLGGTQVYTATATLYLGQPYSASGTVALQGANTNPSAIGTVIHTQQVELGVAAHCKAKVSDFRKGISTKTVTGALTKNGQTPLVQLTVQAKRAKVAQCAANGLANAAGKRLGTYAVKKIEQLRKQIAFDNTDIKTIEAAGPKEVGEDQAVDEQSQNLGRETREEMVPERLVARVMHAIAEFGHDAQGEADR